MILEWRNSHEGQEPCPRSYRQSTVKAGFKCRHCFQSWVHLPPCYPISHDHLWDQWSSTEIHQGLFSFSLSLPETLEISFWPCFHDLFWKSVYIYLYYCPFLIFCIDSSSISLGLVWKLFSHYICMQINFHSLSTMWRILKCMCLILYKVSNNHCWKDYLKYHWNNHQELWRHYCTRRSTFWKRD